jgi:1-phosphatidylinositol-4-phosphate 5-kinase
MCRFVDYAPYIFHAIRKASGISSKDYLSSIGPEQLIQGLLTGDVSGLAELCSPGKSGSFLYFTDDGNFILKTISRDEMKIMKATLQAYHMHLIKRPDSLITKYYGMHKIKLKLNNGKIKFYYFVMMSNVFKTNKTLRYKFDLKGSTYQRTTNINGLNSR